MSTIDKFLFAAPKIVKSGSSIELKITVTVQHPPKTLALAASDGYTCEPKFRRYETAGTQDDPFFIVLEGPPGNCVLSGTLGASDAEDAAEVT